jgi:hypothetical protein
MPVRVSKSFWVTGPIFSMPLGRQMSLPWSTILPTGEMTAAVPHRPHSAKSLTSLEGYLTFLDLEAEVFVRDVEKRAAGYRRQDARRTWA